MRNPYPPHYDPDHLIDMVRWVRVLRKIYVLSGNKDAVEKTYIMAARVRQARERETSAYKQQQTREGFHVTKRRDEDEFPYR